jgi:hypothetical protein
MTRAQLEHVIRAAATIAKAPQRWRDRTTFHGRLSHLQESVSL